MASTAPPAGLTGEKGKITALVDSDDIHCLMIGAAGVGKTAFFLYPNLGYACACGMSLLALDTKGDLLGTTELLRRNIMAIRYPSLTCATPPVRMGLIF